MDGLTLVELEQPIAVVLLDDAGVLVLRLTSSNTLPSLPALMVPTGIASRITRAAGTSIPRRLGTPSTATTRRQAQR